MLGTRDPSKLSEWLAGGGRGARAGTMAEAAVKAAGPRSLAGKTVLDACNPIADAPPEDGVLKFSTGPNESLMERL